MRDSLVLLSYLLILAGNYLDTLEDQVKQLKQMVTETKQSLQDQKRLQYLENLYREKILQDELNEELLKEQDAFNDRAQNKKDVNKLSFKDNKRRLQSAYKAGAGGKAAVSSHKGRFHFVERQSAAAGAAVGSHSQKAGAKQGGYRSINHLQKRMKERGVSAAGVAFVDSDGDGNTLVARDGRLVWLDTPTQRVEGARF